MPEKINPHDRFFKQTFTDVKIAGEFLRHYLPISMAVLLDTERVEVMQTSYVDKKLKEHLSDVLYRVPLNQGGNVLVYVLIEHKSYTDKWVALQLLRYLVQIWEDFRRNNKDQKLPFVFPIVFYHGRSGWTVSKKFSDLFELEGETKHFSYFLPEFEYHLFDLTKYLDKDLIGYAPLAAALRLLRDIFRRDLRDKLPATFEILETEELSETDKNERTTAMLNYLLYAEKFDEENLGKEFEDVFGAKGEIFMKTIMGTWMKQGLEQGKELGLEEGKELGKEFGLRQGKVEIISNFINRKFGKTSDKIEGLIQKLSISDLDKLSLALFDLETAEELEKWLLSHVKKIS